MKKAGGPCVATYCINHVRGVLVCHQATPEDHATSDAGWKVPPPLGKLGHLTTKVRFFCYSTGKIIELNALTLLYVNNLCSIGILLSHNSLCICTCVHWRAFVYKLLNTFIVNSGYIFILKVEIVIIMDYWAMDIVETVNNDVIQCNSVK